MGAVVVDPDGQLVGEGFNGTLREGDVTAHAEIVALRSAFDRLGNHRLPVCTLYVTLEPCAMCAGAVMHARLQRLVYGASDEKFGACGSRIDLFDGGHGLNHHASVCSGVLANDSVALLQSFFKEKR